jgi:hypothetical protein
LFVYSLQKKKIFLPTSKINELNHHVYPQHHLFLHRTIAKGSRPAFRSYAVNLQDSFGLIIYTVIAATGLQQPATDLQPATTGSQQTATGPQQTATDPQQAATGLQQAATDRPQPVTDPSQSSTAPIALLLQRTVAVSIN